MYNSLKLKNLKTFKTDQVLKIAPITLIYGENSSGKTAILKSFDIVHNIFAEHRIRFQRKTVEEKYDYFSRIGNISANKVHFYSYQLNKKPINLELNLNLPFLSKQNALLENEIKTRYLISGRKRSVYYSPIKINLNIKYSKKNKFSKVNNIKIKRVDNTELLTFDRLDKKNKPLSSGEIGYFKDKENRWLRGYSSRGSRFSFDSNEDYFLNKNFYSDYKIKLPNPKILWEDEYASYKKIFSQKKDISERRKFMQKLVNFISIIKYSDFASSSYSSIVYYVVFKMLENKKLSLEKILNLKKLNQIDFNKPENLAKAIISGLGKNSDFIDKKEKIKILKLTGKAEKKYNIDCISFDLLTSLRRKLTKKESKFAQIFLLCNNFKRTFNVNHLVLSKSLEKNLPSSVFFSTASNELTNRCLLRFYKRGPAIACRIIKSSGQISYSTFDFLFLISKFIIGDLDNCFWDNKKKDELPNLETSTLSSNLISKCINEIRRTIDNYIICRPNTTNVPYNVPRETDLPEDFYSKEFEKWLDKTGKLRGERIMRHLDRASMHETRVKEKHNSAHMISANGTNLDRIILKDPKLLKKLNLSLKKLLDLEIVLVTPVFLRKILKDPALYKRYLAYRPTGMGASKKRFIMLKDLKFKKTFTIHGDEVGKGPSNILPFLGQLLSDKPEMTYLIQELENNWHPKYQSKIIDLIVENIKNSIKKTVILETHSELFILKIKKLVQKKIISHKDVSINYVKRQQDGSSEIINIPLNELGGFEKEWPGGFFKERMEILSS
jgi:predicted ATPase